MKKLSLILAATTLVASVGAFADVLKNDASPFAVNVPNIRSGFEINVEGLFLKPTNSDLDYGYVTDSDTYNANLLTVKPDTDFGWGIGMGYVFPNSGNDVQLSWTGFSHTDTDTFNLSVPANSYFAYLNTPWGDTFDKDNPNLDNSDTTYAVSHAQFKLSALDLNVGQYIDVGTQLQLHPFAGLRFARVESNLKSSYVEEDLDDDEFGERYAEDDSFNSKFNGIGPLVGMDANYQLGGGFGASAHLATALLVGKVKAHSDFNYVEAYYDEGGILQSPAEVDVAALRADDVTRIVPAFDAKLGLNYSYTFDCESVVTLEGGYKTTQYIDAVDRVKFTDPNESDTISRTTSSVGFSGPYVKLSLKI